MPLSIEQRIDQNVAFIELSGAMTLGPSLHALSTLTRKLLETPTLTGMILDVSGVTIVDSAGLGELILVYTVAARRNCQVILSGATPSLIHSLEITRLDALLPSAPNAESARKKLAEKKS